MALWGGAREPARNTASLSGVCCTMTTRVAWIALGAVACTAAAPRRVGVEVAATGDLPSAPLPALAATAETTCEAKCLGYSPSTGMWLCGSETTAGGMVSWRGTRCALQLLRDESVLAEVSVFAEAATGGQAFEQTLPFEQALRLAPPDLVRATRFALVPGQEFVIPGSRHRLKWDQPGDVARGTDRSKITVLCNRTQPPVRQAYRTSGHGSGNPGLGGDPPAPVLVFLGPSQCELHESYLVEVAPGAARVALIEDVRWGCVDYSISQRRAHPIDLARACKDDAPPP